MFNIGPMELILILVVALVVVGPKRLPEVGRTIGKGLREFRKAQDDVKRSLDLGLSDEDDDFASTPPPKWHPPSTDGEDDDAAALDGEIQTEEIPVVPPGDGVATADADGEFEDADPSEDSATSGNSDPVTPTEAE